MTNNPKMVKTIMVRRSEERGHANQGWLDSYHTFSFAGYHDIDHMKFHSLRVINEDRLEPGMGFGSHPHHDMEIFSYVVDGALQHQDSMGHKSTIRAGDIQKITAGSGIIHSEFNASQKDHVHFLQVWIIPEKRDLAPSYQEISLSPADEKSPLQLIGSPQGGKNIVQFNQDVNVYRGIFRPGHTVEYVLKGGRGIWIQMIKGNLQVNDIHLKEGDGASLEDLTTIHLRAQEDSEFMLFDLA